MPTTRARAANAATAASGPTGAVEKKHVPAHQSADRFSFAQYASTLGVHLVLVGFSALYLPQMTRLFVPLAARKTDRPQSAFIEALTADPSSTLGWTTAGLVVLEVWWASWVRKWFFEQTAKGSGVDMKLERVRFDNLLLTRFKDATAFTFCTTLATYVVVIMFGAPIATHILQTGLLAFVIAILTAFTPAFVLGFPSLTSDTSSLVNRLTWTRLFAELSPRNPIEYVMVYPAVGTFVGGWLGAIPIALDWDRPWQSWPLTPLFGSIGGYIIGALVAFTLSVVRWLARAYTRSQLSKSS